MITTNPWGIGHPGIKPGRVPRPYPPAETMDTPENMDRCLNCTEPVCSGECGVVSSRSRKKRKLIAQLAEITYNGGSERFAMEKTGLTKAQIKRYQNSPEYEKEIERLRAKWR